MAERRTELLKRLKENPPEKWDEVMAQISADEESANRWLAENSQSA
jgi:hypothetical protein